MLWINKVPVISIDKVDASPFDLTVSNLSASEENGDVTRHLYEEVGRFYFRKGYLEVLNNFDTASLIDTDGFDLRRIGHKRWLRRLSSRELWVGYVMAHLLKEKSVYRHTSP